MEETLITRLTAKLANHHEVKILANKFYCDKVEGLIDSSHYHNFNDKIEFNKYFSLYGKVYAVPTQTALQKRLRETYNIHVEVNYRKFACSECNGYFYTFDVNKGYFGENIMHGFKTYEAALEAGLQEGLTRIPEPNLN